MLGLSVIYLRPGETPQIRKQLLQKDSNNVQLQDIGHKHNFYSDIYFHCIRLYLSFMI